MIWYIPSWNGDVRLVPTEDRKATRMTIYKPTVTERQMVNLAAAEMLKEGWIKDWTPLPKRKGFMEKSRRIITINATLEQVGPLVVKTLKPGPAVLTAILLKDGEVITSSGSKAELQAAVEQATQPAPPPPEPRAAATVRRPTPCCPDCIPGAIHPASEVLLSFLTPEEHESWA
jgi:hypothetical protein